MNESGQKGGRRDRRIELGNEYGIGGMDEHEKNTMNTWITSNQRSQIFIIQHVFSCTIVPFIRVRKIEEFRPKRCFKRKRERAVMAVTKRHFVVAS